MRSFFIAVAILAAPSVAIQAAPPQVVDFFKARADGHLDAKFIAANEKRGQLLLKNQGEQPLVIRMPEAFAGVPVLAQLGPLPNLDADLAQGVGIPGPGGLNPRLNGRFNVAPERLVDLRPGQQRRLRIESVCLDHGKRTPNARMKYDVVPLADYKPGAELAELMKIFGQERYSQPAVQAVAWHYASDKTMEELTTFRDKRTGRRFFSKAQLKEAYRLRAEVQLRVRQRESAVSASAQAVRSTQGEPLLR